MDYLAPTTLQQLLELIDREGYQVLTADQSLVNTTKGRHSMWPSLVSLRQVPDLSAVVETPGTVQIGSSVCYADMAEHPSIQEVTVLAQALATIGEPHSRNHCSLGGALHYGGAIHAPVIAALMALDAGVVVMHRTGSNQQPLGDFSQRGQRAPLPAGKLASAVVIANLPSSISSYVALERTVGLGPASGIAIFLLAEQGVVKEVRLVVAGFTEQPVRLASVESALLGKSLSPGNIAQASDALAIDIAALSDTQMPTLYALHLIRVLIRRSLFPHLVDGLAA